MNRRFFLKAGILIPAAAVNAPAIVRAESLMKIFYRPEYITVSGYRRYEPEVPGSGPIQQVLLFKGRVLVLRDGIIYMADNGGWVKLLE